MCVWVCGWLGCLVCTVMVVPLNGAQGWGGPASYLANGFWKYVDVFNDSSSVGDTLLVLVVVWYEAMA